MIKYNADKEKPYDVHQEHIETKKMLLVKLSMKGGMGALITQFFF